MNFVLAHSGSPLAPHDLPSTWNFDPVLLLGLVLAGWFYLRGARTTPASGFELWRLRSFIFALLVIAIALISPLEPLSGALASAHMIQHVLLLLMAAPLLALSAPLGRIMRGSPIIVRRATQRLYRRLGVRRWNLRLVHQPAGIWLLHIGTIWLWHASIPYGAALENQAVHILEHAAFVVTAVLFWRLILGPARVRVSHGLAVLLVFGAAMQSVFLSALLTFAKTPWYLGYTATTGRWGLTPLADQQLAGVIMWVPAGLLYLAVALALLVAWVRETENEDAPRHFTSRMLTPEG